MEKKLVEISVNGERQEVAVKTNDTLLEVLRDRLGLIGTKEGCSVGECGACTVLCNGKPILSCITMALDSVGSEITTIEGLSAGDDLDPLQESFVQHGAVQCGFCTPGMLLTAKELVEREDTPTSEQIEEAISGNFCRCTGYIKIMEAIQSTGK